MEDGTWHIVEDYEGNAGNAGNAGDAGGAGGGAPPPPLPPARPHPVRPPTRDAATQTGAEPCAEPCAGPCAEPCATRDAATQTGEGAPPVAALCAAAPGLFGRSFAPSLPVAPAGPPRDVERRALNLSLRRFHQGRGEAPRFRAERSGDGAGRAEFRGAERAEFRGAERAEFRGALPGAAWGGLGVWDLLNL